MNQYSMQRAKYIKQARIIANKKQQVVGLAAHAIKIETEVSESIRRGLWPQDPCQLPHLPN